MILQANPAIFLQPVSGPASGECFLAQLQPFGGSGFSTENKPACGKSALRHTFLLHCSLFTSNLPFGSFSEE
ncbi:hypothetical protein B5F28_08925 [Gemmiger sp. An194]|nr:hypothetical protein B5F28_08925 [Gemmiger sp. An194]